MNLHNELNEDLFKKDSSDLTFKDVINIMLNRPVKLISNQLLYKIREQQVETSVFIYLVISLCSFTSTVIASLHFPDKSIIWFKLWALVHIFEYALIFFNAFYGFYLLKRKTLTYEKFGQLLFPAAILAGLLWGSLPVIAYGTQDMEYFYLAVIVMVMSNLFSFFWMFGFWHLSLYFVISAAFIFITVGTIINMPVLVIMYCLLFFALMFIFMGILCKVITNIHLNQIKHNNNAEVIRLLLKEFEEGAQDWIWETNEDGTLIYISERMKKSTNVHIFQGMDFFDIFKKSTMGVKRLEEYFNNQQTFSNLGLMLQGDEQDIYWLISGKPIYDADNIFSGFRGVGSDVTQEKRVQIAEANQLRYSAIVQMTGSIAHDFNNLLASILGSIELSMINQDTRSSAWENSQKAIKGCLKARDIIAKLLSFSRLDLALQPNNFSLNEAIEEVISEIRPAISKRILLNFEDQADIIIYADRLQFIRAVRNLVENSSQAIDKKGEIKISSHQANALEFPNKNLHQNILNIQNYAIIEIRDNGKGIDEKSSELIFEPFFTTRKDEGGTGLGLSMAHGFARQSDGDLLITNSSSKGTSIQLWLPMSQSTVKTHSTSEIIPKINENNHLTLIDKNILLLEDNISVSESLTTFLSSLNANIYTAYSIADARNYCAQKDMKFDLLLCDIILPDGRGFDFVSEIRTQKLDIPTVYISGFSETLPDNLKMIAQAPFLKKPFMFSELLDVIEKEIS